MLKTSSITHFCCFL